MHRCTHAQGCAVCAGLFSLSKCLKSEPSHCEELYQQAQLLPTEVLCHFVAIYLCVIGSLYITMSYNRLVWVTMKFIGTHRGLSNPPVYPT